MTGSSEGYYTKQKSKLLRDFDKAFGKHGKKILTSHFGDELTGTILEETRSEFEALIPKIPDVGGKKNIWETNLIQCTWALALYQALKSHGKTAEETGKISNEMVEAQLKSYPRWFLHLLGRWQFTKYSKNKMKKHAAESQKRLYLDDWVWSVFEGDGKEFDSGVDITECAVCKFFRGQDASDLAPYLCRTDFAVSRAFGTGLVRTMTLAEGGEKCDFRYKRGRETKQG